MKMPLGPRSLAALLVTIAVVGAVGFLLGSRTDAPKVAAPASPPATPTTPPGVPGYIAPGDASDLDEQLTPEQINALFQTAAVARHMTEHNQTTTDSELADKTALCTPRIESSDLQVAVTHVCQSLGGLTRASKTYADTCAASQERCELLTRPLGLHFGVVAEALRDYDRALRVALPDGRCRTGLLPEQAEIASALQGQRVFVAYGKALASGSRAQVARAGLAVRTYAAAAGKRAAASRGPNVTDRDTATACGLRWIPVP